MNQFVNIFGNFKYLNGKYSLLGATGTIRSMLGGHSLSGFYMHGGIHDPGLPDYTMFDRVTPRHNQLKFSHNGRDYMGDSTTTVNLGQGISEEQAFSNYKDHNVRGSFG